MEVVVVRLFLELGHDLRRICVGPVAEHDDVVTVVGERLWILRIDHQRTVNTDLRLQARVAVVPVGAVLVDLEPVFIHAIRSDAMEAQARYAVHVCRQNDPVPVDGRVLFQAIAHTQRDCVALSPAKNRSRQRAVDGHCRTRCAGNVHRELPDVQVKICAGQYVGLARAGHGPDRRAPHAQPTQ
ncbi:hypothetical protein D3C81_1190120 [compost metagenome]